MSESFDHLEERDGEWLLVWQPEDQDRAIREPLGTDDPEEARRLRDAFMRDWQEKQLGTIPPEVPTISDCLASFLRESEPEEELVQQAVHEFRNLFGPVPLGKIARRHVEDWLSHIRTVKKKRGSELQVRLRLVQEAFQWAVRVGWLQRNPALGVRVSRRPAFTWRGAKIVHSEDVDRLLTIRSWSGALTTLTPVALRAMMALAVYAGLRLEEIVWLDWEDVSEGQRELYIRTKPGWIPDDRQARTLPLVRPLAEALHAHRDVVSTSREGPVFTGRTGLRAEAETARADLEGIAEAIGASDRLSWTGLRNTFASRLVRSGMSLEKVSMLLGHESLAATEKQVEIGELKSEVEAIFDPENHE